MTEVHPAIDRWAILPGDPAPLRRWLTGHQAEDAAKDPLPPPPEESP